MTEFLYLGAILLLRVVQRVASKENSKQMPAELCGADAYLAVKLGLSAAFALAVLVLSGKALTAVTALPPLGWLIACATGLSLTASTVCSLLALRGSSIVLGALFGMAGLLIPTVSGIFLYDQAVSLPQWCGIAALPAAAVLLSSSSQTTNGRLTVKTVLLLLGSMLANGMTMLLQTLYKNFLPAANVTVYSFLQFFIPALVLAAAYLVMNPARAKKDGHAKPITFTKKMLFYLLLAAGSLFGISQISTMASAVIPPAVLFPVSDGGGVIIAAIVAATVYREKITWKSAAGIAVVLCGICLIKFGG